MMKLLLKGGILLKKVLIVGVVGIVVFFGIFLLGVLGLFVVDI